MLCQPSTTNLSQESSNLLYIRISDSSLSDMSILFYGHCFLNWCFQDYLSKSTFYIFTYNINLRFQGVVQTSQDQSPCTWLQHQWCSSPAVVVDRHDCGDCHALGWTTLTEMCRWQVSARDKCSNCCTEIFLMCINMDNAQITINKLYMLQNKTMTHNRR